MSKKAAVVIDTWKLPVFQKHLEAASYKYNAPTKFTADGETLTLQVHYEWVHQLQPIIEAAQKECAAKKKLLQRHSLTREPQPMTDGWRARCSCGWSALTHEPTREDALTQCAALWWQHLEIEGELS